MSEIFDAINSSWKAITILGVVLMIGAAFGRLLALPADYDEHLVDYTETRATVYENRDNIRSLVSRMDRLICIQLAEADGQSAAVCETGGER